MVFKIQLLDNISLKGLQEFNPEKYDVSRHHDNPDAILVRSSDMHNITIPRSVQVIGRAGTGTNNIPIKQLTPLGIPVLNTPGANANAVKELVITGMLLASRNIYPAWDYVQHIEGDDAMLHQQVEQHKKKFAGFELPGKTLGIIGLGQIGVKVANTAKHLGMHVIGYDPAITVRNAWELSSTVQQAESLNNALTHADFVSVHVPLNEHTQHLINEEKFALMKPGVILLNFARAPIIDDNALEQALQQDRVRNYVCDFPSNRFKNNPKVISLPHLGASTQEAEENCAVMIAHQIQAYLEQGQIHNAVNFPNVKILPGQGYRLAIVNANIPNMVAQISTVLSKSNVNILDMINQSRDDIAYTMLDVNMALTPHLLQEIQAIDGVMRVRQL